jgi:hypothetical protein
MEKWIGDRISTFTDKDYTSIIIYPKRERWKEALLLAWVIGFTFVGFYMIFLLLFGLDTIDNSALKDDPNEVLRNQKIYLSVFIAFWVYFEYKVVYGLLWLLFGKELIRIDGEKLSLKNSIFSFGKAKKYFNDNIKKIELIEQKPFSFGFDYENAFWRKGTDSLIFEYLNKTIPFGKKINEKEAKLLMRFMVDRVKKHSKSKK